LAFLVDLSDDSFLGAFPILVSELREYSADLLEKPRVVLGSKLDLPGTSERLDELRASLPEETVLGMSVFTREGIPEVRRAFLDFVLAAERAQPSKARKAESGDPLRAPGAAGLPAGTMWTATDGWKEGD
ncbi:MAG TPA: hypothetical protein VLH39_06900, partial [Magnetospirillaceae bacterium]|nr:hypothetical protein [Magnetospirillaceae bacterium]